MIVLAGVFDGIGWNLLACVGHSFHGLLACRSCMIVLAGVFNITSWMYVC